jgi:hypothetical protein
LKNDEVKSELEVKHVEYGATQINVVSVGPAVSLQKLTE